MSRLRHAKGLPKMAGALTGVHRLEVDKPHPFKPDEEKKHGGKVHGHAHHHKLGRKRGGSVKKKPEHIVGQDGKPSNHGTDIPPEHGGKYVTPVQDVPMSGTESGYGGKTAFGKGHIEDSLKDGGKVKWIQKMHMKKGAETAAAHKAGMSTHGYMEAHKHDSGKAGKRARLGLTLSGMHKHKD